MYRRDIRMTDGSERFGFALEAGQAIGIGGKVRRQRLDRDVAAELRIARTEYLPHSAGTDGGEDLELADASPRLHTN